MRRFGFGRPLIDSLAPIKGDLILARQSITYSFNPRNRDDGFDIGRHLPRSVKCRRSICQSSYEQIDSEVSGIFSSFTYAGVRSIYLDSRIIRHCTLICEKRRKEVEISASKYLCSQYTSIRFIKLIKLHFSDSFAPNNVEKFLLDTFA